MKLYYIALAVLLITGLIEVIILEQKIKKQNKKYVIKKIIKSDASRHLYHTKIIKKDLPLAVPKIIQKALNERRRNKRRKNTTKKK